MAARKAKIVGLKWRQFESKPLENQENDEETSSPVQDKKRRRKSSDLQSENGVNAPQKLTKLGRRLSQAVSVTGLGMRETFGSFRQKIRASTRRRKRLFEVNSPYHTISQTQTPIASNQQKTTPNSAHRRSARIASRNETAMYSPFGIETPGARKPTTPGKIRMGTHEPKRFNFSSPGQLQKDLNTVEESLRQLNKLSEQLSGPKTPRSGIRTTPGGRKARRKPIFV